MLTLNSNRKKFKNCSLIENKYMNFRCETCLGEFLLNISKTNYPVDFYSMANILVVHSQSTGGALSNCY